MAYRKIGRETRQRHSVFAGLTVDVIMNEGVVTTEAKAKKLENLLIK